MMKSVTSVLQRAFLNRLDAKLVRASWLEETISQCKIIDTTNAHLTSSHHELKEKFEETATRFSNILANLASAHRHLLRKYDILTEDYTTIKENSRSVETRLQSDLDKMTINSVHAEAKYAELQDTFNEYKSNFEKMMDLYSQAEPSPLTATISDFEDLRRVIESSIQVITQEVGGLAEAVNGSVRNVIYAADLTTVPTEETSEGLRCLARLLRPKAAVGPPKIRLGGSNDGGYVMLDDLERVRTAYSLGVGDNVSWDLSLAHRGIHVYQFDHTVALPPILHPNFHFQQKRIAIVATDECESLNSMRRFATDSDPITDSILKMDIEHDEWDILDHADPAMLRPYSQIICEFHWVGRAVSREWLAKAKRVFEKLNNDFQVIHIHGNNCGPYSLIAGVPMPSVLEVTYCNRQNYEFQDIEDLFPGPLDAPNNPAAPDLFLGAFRF